MTARNVLNAAAYAVNFAMTGASFLLPMDNRGELSEKYQTIITPAGPAFSIWGVIFIWELVFVVAQFFPRFRHSKVVAAVSPFWVATCFFQTLWTPLFAFEILPGALAVMLCILISLIGLITKVDGLGRQSCLRESLLIAPFGVHCGWILCASALNFNVVLVAQRWDQTDLLASAIVSLAVVFAGANILSMSLSNANFLIPLVLAWASLWINRELTSASILLDRSREFYIPWEESNIEAVRGAAGALSVAALVLAVVTASLRVRRCRLPRSEWNARDSEFDGQAQSQAEAAPEAVSENERMDSETNDDVDASGFAV